MGQYDLVIKMMNARFDKLDSRFDKVDKKIDNLQQFKWKVVSFSAAIMFLVSVAGTIIKG